MGNGQPIRARKLREFRRQQSNELRRFCISVGIFAHCKNPARSLATATLCGPCREYHVEYWRRKANGND